MLSQKREQQSLFYTALHKSAFKELDPVGEPDMRMSSDSGVKTETNTQREEEPWAFTKEGQSERAQWLPGLLRAGFRLGAGAGLSSVGWGFRVPGGESCFTLSLL